MDTKQGISGATLKWIAIITMLLDHIGAVILERYIAANAAMFVDISLPTLFKNGTAGLIYGLYFMLRLIGRMGFPMFCFLLVEGFEHTHNRAKYALRLLMFCFISEVPFDFAIASKAFAWDYQNVFFTLLIGFLVMWGVREGVESEFAATERGKQLGKVLQILGFVAIPVYITTMNAAGIVALFKRNETFYFLAEDGSSLLNVLPIALCLLVLIAFMAALLRLYIVKYGKDAASYLLQVIAIVCAGMAVGNLLRTDYSAAGVLTIAVMYMLRNDRVRALKWGCVILILSSVVEVFALFDLIPIRRYNGTRGRQMKYFFYLFYPVHLLVLYLICKILGLA